VRCRVHDGDPSSDCLPEPGHPLDGVGDVGGTRQDLAEQALAVDRALIAAVSQSPQDRNASRETVLRQQVAEIGAKLRDTDAALAGRFPEYAALTYPSPISVPAIQELLKPEEALLLFAPRMAKYCGSPPWEEASGAPTDCAKRSNAKASANRQQRDGFNFMGSTSEEKTAGRIRMGTVNMNARGYW
jgi:hypothetical protein